MVHSRMTFRIAICVCVCFFFYHISLVVHFVKTVRLRMRSRLKIYAIHSVAIKDGRDRVRLSPITTLSAPKDCKQFIVKRPSADRGTSCYSVLTTMFSQSSSSSHGSITWDLLTETRFDLRGLRPFYTLHSDCVCVPIATLIIHWNRLHWKTAPRRDSSSATHPCSASV